MYLQAFVRPESLDLVAVWQEHRTNESREEIYLTFGDKTDEVKSCLASLVAQLVPNTIGHPQSTVNNRRVGNGLEAMRSLMLHHDSRRLGTKVAVLNSIINTAPSKTWGWGDRHASRGSA